MDISAVWRDSKRTLGMEFVMGLKEIFKPWRRLELDSSCLLGMTHLY
jgi:hypothetical protein